MATKKSIWVLIPMLLLALVAISGCASAPTGGRTVDVTGTWEGIFTCQGCHGGTGKQGSMSMKLSQEGATVSGKMLVAEAPDAEVKGSVAGDTFKLSATGVEKRGLQYHGPMNATFMVGSKEMQGNGFAGQMVSIRLRRIQ